jgi:transcriptional regulator with XRE-family HTH domain
MFIGERLKALREHKKMSQGDIEKRTGGQHRNSHSRSCLVAFMP